VEPRHTVAVHLDDVALACACADGDEEAWERFVRDYRPILYRSADALDPSGGAREIADSLYAELFGLKEKGGERQSLFRYYEGRSSLATWLRAVLAQRYVDRLRAARRVDPLPEEASPAALASPASSIEIDADRRRFAAALRRALELVVAALPPRDRLRLACYYADGLTLAETGRVLREHEATASRNLARTRKDIRNAVERRLRDDDGMSEAEVEQCFECAGEDAGALDLQSLLVERKK
jgi:RNA polymerase sigma-70 factor, ECF subfamily